MTNLAAIITFELVTNWTHTATTRSVQSGDGAGVTLAVYHASGYHERGNIYSNTVATIQWNGQSVKAILESLQIGETNRIVWR